MTDFNSMFADAKSNSIKYNGLTVYGIDRFPVKNRDTLLLSIDSTNSDCKQGLCVDVTGYCEIDGTMHKQGKGIRALFWEDTMPNEVYLKVFTKKSSVVVYNIWENTDHLGNISLDYWSYGAAMLIENIENGRRYRCNDWHPDEDFNDIIFTVRNLTSPELLNENPL